MAYIYDILLNFLDYPYEFFEWNDNDDIKYIKKVPLFKVKTDILIDILENDIIIDKSFLEMIDGKTKLYDDKDYIRYVSLFSDGKMVIGVKCLPNKTLVSRLLIDEEQDIIDHIDRLEFTDLNYQIIKKRYFFENLTRYEKAVRSFLLKEIDYLYRFKFSDKLSYYYFEYFGADCCDIKKAYEDLVCSIKNDFNKKHENIYNIMKLSLNIQN